MFDNIGSKVKGLAKFTCWIGIICSVIVGIYLMTVEVRVVSSYSKYASYEHPYTWYGVGLIVGGILGSWLGSLALYAIGEAAENSAKIIVQNEEILKKLNDGIDSGKTASAHSDSKESSSSFKLPPI